jgi:hypothetical protein
MFLKSSGGIISTTTLKGEDVLVTSFLRKMAIKPM